MHLFLKSYFSASPERHAAPFRRPSGENRGPSIPNFATLPIFELTEAQCAALTGGTNTYLRPKMFEYSEISDLCDKFKIKTGIQVRLPTEAQWEYASRSGMTTALHTGNDVTVENVNLVARWDGNVTDGKEDSRNGALADVGCYFPNAIGLYDMHGNASEWCTDEWSESLGDDAVIDPNSIATNYAVVKGGGFHSWRWRPSCYTYTSGALPDMVFDNESDAKISSCRNAYRTFGAITGFAMVQDEKIASKDFTKSYFVSLNKRFEGYLRYQYDGSSAGSLYSEVKSGRGMVFVQHGLRLITGDL